MGSPDKEDGPDASSLRPVSALLSQFEKMTKGPDQTQTQLARLPSPAPKPDRLRDLHGHSPAPSLNQKEPPNAPSRETKAWVRETSDTTGPILQAPPATAENVPRSPGRPPPLLDARPVHAALNPPSLTIDPPQSPPKVRSLTPAPFDQTNFLNPDAVVKPASPSISPRPFQIPSHPHSPATPVLDPRRSPRLMGVQPPSPPPPRRSAELRRDRDPKTIPPLTNRAAKPSNRNSFVPEAPQGQANKPNIPEKVSPFSSPPSSNCSLDDEAPPSLPTRPRPQMGASMPQKAKTIQVDLEPPPVHHLVAKRQDQGSINGTSKGSITPQLTGDQRPVLPTRPLSVNESSSYQNGTQTMRPPPRPPRPGISMSVGLDINPPLSTKRAVSNPTTQPMLPPPRPHHRTLTLERDPEKVSYESRPMSMVYSTASESRTSDSTVIHSQNKPEQNTARVMTYPDSSYANRRHPYIKQGVHEIPTKYDARIFDVCGELLCTSGNLTRVWSLLDGELLMSLGHSEGVKATAIAFKPGANVDEEGRKLWIGNSVGELMEMDIMSSSIVAQKVNPHQRHEIIKIYRHYNELWTLDDGGTLHVWGADEAGVSNLENNPSQTYRVPRAHTFSIVVGDQLWHATGKEIRIFLPTVEGREQFQVLIRALYQEGAGEVISGTLMPSDPDKVFFGHNDGKVTIYSKSDYSCLGLVHASTYKINSLAGVGQYLWAGYNNGRICVYDIGQTPWLVKKDWQAHQEPVVRIQADRSSFYKLGRLQVVSLGVDNVVKAWDGLIQEDWLEDEMHARDVQYCEFDKLKAVVMTWNAGASTPNSLRYSESDATFIQNVLQSSDSPDILVFGFQELVDLEDKTATAKRILKVKKKEGSDQERMSHQYRDWRDFLVRSLDDYMAGDLYHLLHTATLVGLFTCIFVKADLRDRIHNLSSAEVKRGMGGLHGNKGAIVVRFMIDDTSLCFINCHLAAGQTQASHRHNDIAAILDANILPIERDSSIRIDSYVGGGDGTMILDHELCLLNGDLNYRIDTMSRDTVVSAVKANNLAKLLDRDQLLVARRRNPAFRLRAFEEMPITFAPTYKYDVGTDTYDSSEKKRSPAWCDRLLYRGAGRIQQLDYLRHEVRVSDHRPVTGRFRFTVKRISPKKRAVAWMECQQQFEDVKEKQANEEKLYYLIGIIGYDESTSRALIKERSSRRVHRSPSRHRE